MERAKTHPILIAAGVAVLLFSLLGIVAAGSAHAAAGECVGIVDGASLERA